MMSTNTMSGWWSAIFASASNPSIAVKTSQPSLARRVSAVRRIVLLSSITRTFRPWSFVLLPVTVRQLLQLDLRLEPAAPEETPWPTIGHSGERGGRRLHAMPGASPSTPSPPERGAGVLTYTPTPRHAARVTFSSSIGAKSAAPLCAGRLCDRIHVRDPGRPGPLTNLLPART